MSNCKAKERCQHLPESRGEWLVYCEQCVHDSMTVGGPEYQKNNLKPYSVEELIAQLSASQAREAELREKLEAEIESHGATITREAQLSLRLESAEARIKASQEQEPVAEVFWLLERNDLQRAHWLTLKDCGAGWYWTTNADKAMKFKANIDAWWMRKILLSEEWNNFSLYGIEISITEHVFYSCAQFPIQPELAELQRENTSLADLYQQEVAKRAEAQHRCGIYTEQLEELRKLLEESKVPEGWQLVPKEPTEEMLHAMQHSIDFDRSGQNTYELEHASQTTFEFNGEMLTAGTTLRTDLTNAYHAALSAAIGEINSPETDLEEWLRSQ